MKRAAFYASVSAGGQTADDQLHELEVVAARLGWEVAGRFVDQGIWGTKGRDRRPALDSMLNAVTRGEVDVVAAWSVDRLGRSLQELVAILTELRSREVDLYLHQQDFDTTTPSGRAMYQMLGVFAAFERAIISEHTKARMAQAKAEGKPITRPPVDEGTIGRMQKLRAEGHSVRWIAEEVGVAVGTVMKYTKVKDEAARVR